MINNKYLPVIGLEVHVELKTKSKMFCGCSTEYFGKEPNTHTCPVCLGLPGALPVPNKKAIEWCLMIGMALNCEIPMVSKFDRKNYFYPDLAKGYQISQYDQPFAVSGSIKLESRIPPEARRSKNPTNSVGRQESRNEKGKEIGIRRVHMEEDTAKLSHGTQTEKGVSLIDFNRSGVPLVEVVTEPDFESATEVKEYLQKLQQIIRYLGVSDADMEKGEMRLEPNISLRQISNDKFRMTNDKLPKYKVEVKNINSFKFVEKAINYEVIRQEKILEEGKIPVQETRGWDEKRQKTFSQRVKEEAQDYRYFPEPDIPPIKWTNAQISKVKDLLPELPDKKLERFENEYGLPYYDAEILTREKTMADYFEESVSLCHPELVSGSSIKAKEMPKQVRHDISSKDIANWMINKKIDIAKLTPTQLIQTIQSSTQTSQVDEGELGKIIKQVLVENAKAVEDYKKGKQASIMFLLGQTMRKIGKKVDANMVREKIEKELKSNIPRSGSFGVTL